MERIFKRKIYEWMLEWKSTRNGSTSLLIKGARRIGKSTIAEEFARNEYESYIAVDFANAPVALWEAIDNISDLNNFFLQLQFIYNVKLTERKSVIIFDEIQKCPRARQAIKYLVKDGRYDYIETGSLLSIRKNTKDIVIPSEETRLSMYPMDYEEFQWAIGNDVGTELIQTAFDGHKSLGDNIARKCMRDFRLYMLIGGMPQAVNRYLDTNNLSEVDKVKREILELYLDDFEKIDSSGRAAALFRSIPSQLALNRSRYQTTAVLGKKESEETLTEVLKALEDSMTVNICNHANDPGVGMPMRMDYSRYKMYLADTGLFVTLAFWDKSVTENLIYQKLLSDKLARDIGYVYENIVAQTLVANGNRLFYYTWPTPSGKHYFEIDFLLSSGSKISPVEVKSSGYKTHVSLDAFREKFSERISESYLIYTKDYRREGMLTYLPAFMTFCLR
ncbi:MAG: AAA family ATPase [Muribaculaceae bacterium]|nr:AAA family ATPase [Muribaculaceae bacterium]